MNLFAIIDRNIAGLLFTLLFMILMLIFAVSKSSRRRQFREIPAFAKLRRGIGLAVEAGTRLHVSLGHGGITGMQGSSGFIGLSALQRIARVASISDRPPVATSGEGTLAILSQETLKNTFNSLGASNQYNARLAQMSGVTPFTYAAGALSVISDEQVSVNLLSGTFGSEAALLVDGAERAGSLTLAGSDQLPAQSIFFATAGEALIGEELYAAGAYTQAGPWHIASLQTQDVLRWILIGVILAGSILKLVGVL